MTKAYIAKTAAASGLGDTIQENWDRLMAGRCAVGAIRHFEADRLPCRQAACVSDLRLDPSENHTCALMRRVLDRIRPIPAGTFIIWTGIKGNAQYIESGLESGLKRGS